MALLIAGLFYAADEPRTKLGGLAPAVFHGFNSIWIVHPSAITGAATELYGTFGQSKRYRATGNAT
jgi:hypothetical protein